MKWHHKLLCIALLGAVTVLGISTSWAAGTRQPKGTAVKTTVKTTVSSPVDEQPAVVDIEQTTDQESRYGDGPVVKCQGSRQSFQLEVSGGPKSYAWRSKNGRNLGKNYLPGQIKSAYFVGTYETDWDDPGTWRPARFDGDTWSFSGSTAYSEDFKWQAVLIDSKGNVGWRMIPPHGCRWAHWGEGPGFQAFGVHWRDGRVSPPLVSHDAPPYRPEQD